KTPEGKAQADHLWSATVSAGKDASEAKAAVAAMLSELALEHGSDADSSRQKFDWLLEGLPTVLTDVAARFGDLQVAGKDGKSDVWSKSVGASLLATLRAPAGFEEASPRDLANATRALSICADHQPKGDDGESPKAPPLAGTPRKVEGDPKAAYH